jgi:hypothetical protein
MAGESRNAARRREVLRALCHGNYPSCECCREATYCFLTVDHIHGGGTAERRAFGHTTTWRIVWREYRTTGEWPTDRYRVLCANCNQAFRVGGACPHQVEA